MGTLNCEYKGKVLKGQIKTLKECMLDIALANIEGMDETEAKYYLEVDAIPSIGSVSGLLYYSETKNISCVFYDEIVDLVKDGYGDVTSSTEVANAVFNIIGDLNNMAWFAWKHHIIDDGFVEEVLEKAKELKVIKS